MSETIKCAVCLFVCIGEKVADPRGLEWRYLHSWCDHTQSGVRGRGERDIVVCKERIVKLPKPVVNSEECLFHTLALL